MKLAIAAFGSEDDPYMDIARAIMFERERCAKVAETPEIWKQFSGDFEGNCIAAAIRSGK